MGILGHALKHNLLVINSSCTIFKMDFIDALSLLLFDRIIRIIGKIG